jgi:hypothetical protein
MPEWVPSASDAEKEPEDDHELNDDRRLDEALELTFPASDPVALSGRRRGGEEWER